MPFGTPEHSVPARPFRDDPAHWLLRAEEARAIAETMETPTARDTFLRFAAEYDSMARQASIRARLREARI